MKLLVQGDDFGFTKAVTLGIIEGIDNGILRNTGMFTNMPSASLAASLMKERPQACFGVDFNLVAGKPVSDPQDIPHLVDDSGSFHPSGSYVRNPLWQSEEGRRKLFPKEEVEREIRAQYNRFIELTGQKPGYLHTHSLSPETYLEAIHQLSLETGIPFSKDIAKELNITVIGMKRSKASAKKVFDPQEQLDKDTLGLVLAEKEKLLNSEIAMIGGHPGYVDAELLKLTTLSLERCKDLLMVTSKEMKELVETHHIELITYYDLLKILKEKR